MAILIYKGGAMDHEVKPQKYPRGMDGKEDRRQPLIQEAVTTFKELPAVTLWGVEFPKGEEVKTSDKSLIRKAMALAHFEVREVEPKIEAAIADEEEKEAEPKRRGRPRKGF
jgi:hypothetical protein